MHLAWRVQDLWNPRLDTTIQNSRNLHGLPQRRVAEDRWAIRLPFAFHREAKGSSSKREEICRHPSGLGNHVVAIKADVAADPELEVKEATVKQDVVTHLAGSIVAELSHYPIFVPGAEQVRLWIRTSDVPGPGTTFSRGSFLVDSMMTGVSSPSTQASSGDRAWECPPCSPISPSASPGPGVDNPVDIAVLPWSD